MADVRPDKSVDYSAALAAEQAHGRLREALETAEARRRIAELTGIPAPTLKDYWSGRTSPPLDRFLLIAMASGREPAWFFGDGGAVAAPGAPGVVIVPVMDVRASAGPGAAADVVRAVDAIPFAELFARKIAGPGARLECLRAQGDSMAPTITDGALLIIDRTQTRPIAWRKPARKTPRRPQPQDEIFVFYQGEDLRLKRLRDVGEDFVAILSDNGAENPPEIVKPGRDGSFKIVGKVVWWDNRL